MAKAFGFLTFDEYQKQYYELINLSILKARFTVNDRTAYTVDLYINYLYTQGADEDILKLIDKSYDDPNTISQQVENIFLEYYENNGAEKLRNKQLEDDYIVKQNSIPGYGIQIDSDNLKYGKFSDDSFFLDCNVEEDSENYFRIKEKCEKIMALFNEIEKLNVKDNE